MTGLLFPVLGRATGAPQQPKPTTTIRFSDSQAVVRPFAQTVAQDNVARDLLKYITEATTSGQLTWQLQPAQKRTITYASGDSRTVTSDALIAVDPKMVRPDNTGQHYQFCFWLSPKQEQALIMKGELQQDAEGMIVTPESAGNDAYEAMVNSIREKATQPK
jgi:hypothetical protein